MLESDWNLFESDKGKIRKYRNNNELIVSTTITAIFNHIGGIAGIWPCAERKRALLTVKSQEVNDLMNIDA